MYHLLLAVLLGVLGSPNFAAAYLPFLSPTMGYLSTHPRHEMFNGFNPFYSPFNPLPTSMPSIALQPDLPVQQPRSPRRRQQQNSPVQERIFVIRNTQPSSDRNRQPASDRGRQPASDRNRQPASDRGRQPGSDRGRQPSSDRRRRQEQNNSVQERIFVVRNRQPSPDRRELSERHLMSKYGYGGRSVSRRTGFGRGGEFSSYSGSSGDRFFGERLLRDREQLYDRRGQRTIPSLGYSDSPGSGRRPFRRSSSRPQDRQRVSSSYDRMQGSFQDRRNELYDVYSDRRDMFQRSMQGRRNGISGMRNNNPDFRQRRFRDMSDRNPRRDYMDRRQDFQTERRSDFSYVQEPRLREWADTNSLNTNELGDRRTGTSQRDSRQLLNLRKDRRESASFPSVIDLTKGVYRTNVGSQKGQYRHSGQTGTVLAENEVHLANSLGHDKTVTDKPLYVTQQLNRLDPSDQRGGIPDPRDKRGGFSDPRDNRRGFPDPRDHLRDFSDPRDKRGGIPEPRDQRNQRSDIPDSRDQRGGIPEPRDQRNQRIGIPEPRDQRGGMPEPRNHRGGFPESNAAIFRGSNLDNVVTDKSNMDSSVPLLDNLNSDRRGSEATVNERNFDLKLNKAVPSGRRNDIIDPAGFSKPGIENPRTLSGSTLGNSLIDLSNKDNAVPLLDNFNSDRTVSAAAVNTMHLDLNENNKGGSRGDILYTTGVSKPGIKNPGTLSGSTLGSSLIGLSNIDNSGSLLDNFNSDRTGSDATFNVKTLDLYPNLNKANPSDQNSGILDINEVSKPGTEHPTNSPGSTLGNSLIDLTNLDSMSPLSVTINSVKTNNNIVNYKNIISNNIVNEIGPTGNSEKTYSFENVRTNLKHSGLNTDPKKANVAEIAIAEQAASASSGKEMLGSPTTNSQNDILASVHLEGGEQPTLVNTAAQTHDVAPINTRIGNRGDSGIAPTDWHVGNGGAAGTVPTDSNTGNGGASGITPTDWHVGNGGAAGTVPTDSNTGNGVASGIAPTDWHIGNGGASGIAPTDWHIGNGGASGSTFAHAGAGHDFLSGADLANLGGIDVLTLDSDRFANLEKAIQSGQTINAQMLDRIIGGSGTMTDSQSILNGIEGTNAQVFIIDGTKLNSVTGDLTIESPAGSESPRHAHVQEVPRAGKVFTHAQSEHAPAGIVGDAVGSIPITNANDIMGLFSMSSGGMDFPSVHSSVTNIPAGIGKLMTGGAKEHKHGSHGNTHGFHGSHSSHS